MARSPARSRARPSTPEHARACPRSAHFSLRPSPLDISSPSVTDSTNRPEGHGSSGYAFARLACCGSGGGSKTRWRRGARSRREGRESPPEDAQPACVLVLLFQSSALSECVSLAERSPSTSGYTNAYVWIVAALLGVLILRNLVVKVALFFDGRRQKRATSAEKGRRNGFDVYNDRIAVLRWSEKLESLALKPARGLPTDWTYLRLLLVAAIVIINTVFCVVSSYTWILPAANRTRHSQVGSTQLHSAQSAGSSIARAFSRRCGRVATANYPLLFMFAGRNSVIAKLTGTSSPTFLAFSARRASEELL